jgi:hypothetical protein
MPRWLAPLVRRIHRLVAAGRVRMTLKAVRELALLEFGLDEQDACDVLAALEEEDFARRLASARTGEWLYVFKPRIGGRLLYVKLVVRRDCIVVSFHEEVEDEEEDA